MVKRTTRDKTKQYAVKVHRQHTSLVVTVPKGLCVELDISKGDMLLFEVEPGGVVAAVGKMTLKGPENGKDTSSPGKLD